MTTDDVQQKDRRRRGRVHSQLDNHGPGLDLVHLHEGETFCAGKLLLGFIVLEFEEDSCSWKKAHARYAEG